MDLRQLLQQFKARGELRTVSVPVDPNLELAALCRREFARPEGSGLLFKVITGYRFQAVANIFGSDRRMATVLRCTDLGQFSGKLRRVLQSRVGTAAAQRLQGLKGTDPAARSCDPLWTHRPGATLEELPAITSWPQEQRPYLTLPLVISRHPLTGDQNLGIYRVQVAGDKQLAINIRPGSGAGEHLAAARKLRKKLPVSLIFGGDPALTWLASAPLPSGCDEYRIFENLFDERLPLSITETDGLMIPADAEFVVQGTISPGETCREGPFGNHTGSYVTRADCPLMQIASIAWREEAIMPLTVVGPPPSENIFLGQANEILIREMLRIDHPEISGLLMPESTIFHGVALLQISEPGVSGVRDLIQQLWQTGPLSHSKLLVLFDADVELENYAKAYWRLINRLNGSRIHCNGDRIAIDATGIDPNSLVTEDRATTELLQRRCREYFNE